MHPLMRLELGDGLAFPLHRAFLRRQQAHQHTQQRSLAYAVAAQQAGDFTDLHIKRQTAKNVAATVILMKLFDLEHGECSRRLQRNRNVGTRGVWTGISVPRADQFVASAP